MGRDPQDIPGLGRGAVIALTGVHWKSASERQYSVSSGAHVVVGHVDADDRGLDGVELALDSILRGVPGKSTLARSKQSGIEESPSAPTVLPIAGDTVVLTLNHQLEEIAENALADAVTKMGAEGGDIVILDPHSGEIRALASVRGDHAATTTALTEPFEPGSTMKPFIAAGLLQRGLVSDADTVDTGDGTLELNGRTIHDDHLVGRAPLVDVIRWSSNVGIIKFGERLSAGEEFETLRDFGFGTTTGVPFPSEASGTLNEPARWSKQSANSMAIGYEVAVTPLQLAAAYAAFANGGQLLEPALVKEIRAPDGTVLYQHTPRVVRQVVSPAVSTKVLGMLVGVVEDGTAVQADLSNYLLAGKTGTPKATVHGKYVQGRYNPNFVGLFPGDAPQYVIVVKLTNPQTSIQGKALGVAFAASTAAPITQDRHPGCACRARRRARPQQARGELQSLDRSPLLLAHAPAAPRSRATSAGAQAGRARSGFRRSGIRRRRLWRRSSPRSRSVATPHPHRSAPAARFRTFDS